MQFLFGAGIGKSALSDFAWQDWRIAKLACSKTGAL
jgi:hypothetical protein